MSLLYFAYGSNMHPGRLRARVDSAKPLAIAQLPDHRLVFHKRGADGSGKGNIVADGGVDVWGVIYTLSTRHAIALDGIEGSGYERVQLEVLRSPARRVVSVFSYQARGHAVADDLLPFSWYLDFLLQGAAIHELPAHYVAQLAGVATSIDTDAGRTRRERVLLGLLP